DDPFVINPARYDPSDAMAHTFLGSKSKVLCPKMTGKAVPTRFICVDVVVVIDCHVVHSTNVFRDTSKIVKQLIGSPLRGEHERAAAFFGTVFGEKALGFNTYGISLGGPDTRMDGISYRTFVTNTAAPETSRKGMGFTPRRGNASGKSRSDSVPSRSLLDMRDKTTWSHTDDIGVWDAREYFRADKPDNLVYRHEKLTSLPPCTEDLQFGDIALVYYCTSTYQTSTSSFAEAKVAVSHNLYGVALLARRDEV
ncbi:hypothetical protein L227DRAFT_515424, partial [Lentinus tigrinus ALCF2SS1-6]